MQVIRLPVNKAGLIEIVAAGENWENAVHVFCTLLNAHLISIKLPGDECLSNLSEGGTFAHTTLVEHSTFNNFKALQSYMYEVHAVVIELDW